MCLKYVLLILMMVQSNNLFNCENTKDLNIKYLKEIFKNSNNYQENEQPKNINLSGNLLKILLNFENNIKNNSNLKNELIFLYLSNDLNFSKGAALFLGCIDLYERQYSNALRFFQYAYENNPNKCIKYIAARYFVSCICRYKIISKDNGKTIEEINKHYFKDNYILENCLEINRIVSTK